MSVVLEEEGLRYLLFDPAGPTGLYLAAKAKEVHDHAFNNATMVGRTFTMSAMMFNRGPEVTKLGPRYEVGTTALPRMQPNDNHRPPHDSFPYPLAQELGVGAGGAFPAPKRQPSQNYRYPWLRPALERAGFTESL